MTDADIEESRPLSLIVDEEVRARVAHTRIQQCLEQLLNTSVDAARTLPEPESYLAIVQSAEALLQLLTRNIEAKEVSKRAGELMRLAGKLPLAPSHYPYLGEYSQTDAKRRYLVHVTQLVLALVKPRERTERSLPKGSSFSSGGGVDDIEQRAHALAVEVLDYLEFEPSMRAFFPQPVRSSKFGQLLKDVTGSLLDLMESGRAMNVNVAYAPLVALGRPKSRKSNFFSKEVLAGLKT